MLKTNKQKLVKIAVEGKVAPALATPNRVGHDGFAYSLPAVGSITYNVCVGDSAFGWAADHVEPCVSTILDADRRADKPNAAYNFLACVGNIATITTGAAKGARGVVTGSHGGCEHVLIDLPPRAVEKLTLDDRFQIRTFGQGLKLLDFPEIVVSSLDPKLLAKLKIKASKQKLEVPVAAIIPGKLMGAGLGSAQSVSGDYDLQTADRRALKRHGLDHLKLGDVVAITDHDASYGWRYLEGACVVGVVIHGDSGISGHGPGITTLMTCPTGKIVPKLSKNANIGRYLNIGRYRRA